MCRRRRRGGYETAAAARDGRRSARPYRETAGRRQRGSAVRVLFLTHRLPYMPDRGDRIRALHMIRAISGHADVHLVSLTHDASEAAEAEGLARRYRIKATVLPVPFLRQR